MRTIHLENEFNADELGGTLLGEDSCDFLAQEDCDVYKPNGELLLMFRKGILDPALASQAYKDLRNAASKTTNRGIAAGPIDLSKHDREAGVVSGTRMRPMKKDGTVSSTNYANPVESGIVGYFDPNPRFPFCRQTAWTQHNPEKWVRSLAFIEQIDQRFAELNPERHRAQMEIAEQTSPDFRIGTTSFTTITVNRNWATAVHKDAGDYRPGFGVMTAFDAGKYDGCYTCFPGFRVAADMRAGDLLLADVHEWHGNTPIKPRGRFERISCVFYYREKIKGCGSAEEELARSVARPARPGTS